MRRPEHHHQQQQERQSSRLTCRYSKWPGLLETDCRTKKKAENNRNGIMKVFFGSDTCMSTLFTCTV